MGDRKKATSLDDLDPIYKQLLDKPVVMVLAVIGADGRPGLTPMWFDYEDDHILVNTAEQRPKCKWIRNNPQLTLLLVCLLYTSPSPRDQRGAGQPAYS